MLTISKQSGFLTPQFHGLKENPHFLRSTPEEEMRRNAWLELFNTEDDLETSIFLFFKNSKELCKH